MVPRIGEIINAAPTYSNQYSEYDYRKHKLMKLVGWFAAPEIPDELCDNNAYELVINEMAKRIFIQQNKDGLNSDCRLVGS